MTTLYDPLMFGGLRLANRVFMAPLTRNRALPNGVPGQWAATYYAQRATAGLIISEATQVSPMGKGYINTPGIYSDEQIVGWSRITDAVHAAGGRMFLQLWHVGRISHTSLLPAGESPVAPSPVKARSQTVTEAGFVDVSEPRQLTIQEIQRTVDDYRIAARNAKSAGFDGVEIHAANGYLIDQFLRSGSNVRSDEYGGEPKNRVRFLSEVVEAVIREWDATSVGVRLSPLSAFNDMSDANPKETFDVVVEALNKLHPVYLHVVEEAPSADGLSDHDRALFASLRSAWKGLYVANGGYDAKRGESVVTQQHADAVAYGKLFLANPDLPTRLRLRGPLNEPNRDSFYGGAEHGYIDYPEWRSPSV